MAAPTRVGHARNWCIVLGRSEAVIDAADDNGPSWEGDFHLDNANWIGNFPLRADGSIGTGIPLDFTLDGTYLYTGADVLKLGHSSDF